MSGGTTRTGPPRAAEATVLAAGAFVLAVAAMLARQHFRGGAVDPWDDAAFRTLKAEHKRTGALAEELRARDLELRQRFLVRRAFLARGKYLLLGGLAALTVAGLWTAAATPKRPMPRAGADGQAERARLVSRGRAAVGAAAGGALAAMLAWAAVAGNPFARVEIAGGSATAPASTEPLAATAPSPEEVRKQWPQFRGPGGLGVAACRAVPAGWDGPTGRGVRWKSPVPLPGENSPVVWGGRVFLTGATKDRREVYCFDAAKGGLLWRHGVVGVPGSPAEPPEGILEDDTGYAAPTAATDGRRVCAIFANGDLVCLDAASGRRLWARNLGSPQNTYGHASSLAVWGKLLLVQYDQGEADAGKSELTAFDLTTGQVEWVTGRPVRNSWSSPIVAETPAGPQVITASAPGVIGYEPETGVELWRADVLKGDVGTSPAYEAGMAFVAAEYAQLAAIRTDGSGDVTQTHVAWTAEDNLPVICSPLAAQGRLWLLTAGGTLTCHEAATGRKLYEKELEASFRSSPILAGTTICLLSETGRMILVDSAAEYRELARAELGEATTCTPAILEGRMYVRGKRNLYCIVGKAGATTDTAATTRGAAD